MTEERTPLLLASDRPGLERIVGFCGSEQIDQSTSPQGDVDFESWSAGYDAAIAVVKEFAEKAIAETHAPVDASALLEALRFYADRDSWWSNDASGPGRHRMGEGSMERMVGRPGTIMGLNFIPDAGDRARSALRKVEALLRRRRT
jgi:hypothetical protein